MQITAVEGMAMMYCNPSHFITWSLKQCCRCLPQRFKKPSVCSQNKFTWIDGLHSNKRMWYIGLVESALHASVTLVSEKIGDVEMTSLSSAAARMDRTSFSPMLKITIFIIITIISRVESYRKIQNYGSVYCGAYSRKL